MCDLYLLEGEWLRWENKAFHHEEAERHSLMAWRSASLGELSASVQVDVGVRADVLPVVEVLGMGQVVVG